MSLHAREPPLRLRAVSELTPAVYTFLWQDRLALGEPAIFEGDPGLGKSLVALDLCARLSTGRPMPDGSPGQEPASSVVLVDEDDPEKSIRGRLRALGADLGRVFVLDRHDGEHVAFPHDAERLAEWVTRVQARLVILDPVTSFLGEGVHANSEQAVRRALQPLRHLARRHGFVLLLVRHLNKAGWQKGLYRGSGALAFLGVSRSAWLFGHDPQDRGRVVMAEQKNNVAPPQGSLAYQVGPGEDGQPRLTWLGPSPWRTDDLLKAGPRGPVPAARERAGAFLKQILKDGPLRVSAIWEAASTQGLTESTLQRAREEVGIRVARRSEGRVPVYYWLLGHQQLPDVVPAADGEPDLTDVLRQLEARYPPRSPLDEGG